MNLDGDQVFFVDQNLGNAPTDTLTPQELKNRYKEFLREYMVDNEYVYRHHLVSNGGLDNFYIRIDLEDLDKYDMKIAMELRSKPISTLPLLEEATKELYKAFDMGQGERYVPDFQVQILSNGNPKQLRGLKSEDIGSVIKLQAIIVNSSKVVIKGRVVTLECRFCGHEKRMIQEHGFTSLKMPRYCETKVNKGDDKCGFDPYSIMAEKSDFIDFQILKIQETTDSIPTGEIPRTYRICADRYLVDKLIPGNKVNLTGIYTINEKKYLTNTGSAKQLKMPYIYVLGYTNDSVSGRNNNPLFTHEEEQRFREMSQDKEIYNKIINSVAPSIYGHQNIKKSIACLLFGGSTKHLPDKTKLRGDINVLLIGDPSTAKSQFLKFVHRVAPICIYTSGKGSSAAGLTAAIIKDPTTREFHLEGGALVLADGGIVCIDEFDKMRVQDRVAIHEAMEQQTISIAKAGITTVLNTRASILAAANPIFGSYVNFRDYSEQIELQTTILSRFDCIFTVRDEKTQEHDQKIANHILNIHVKGGNQDSASAADEYYWLRKYISYSRSKFSPRLDANSALKLQNLYVKMRSSVELKKKHKKSHIPITVRQLEALIRLSESIAKMKLSNVVREEDINEAHEIFQKSTMNSLKSKSSWMKSMDPQKEEKIKNIEESIRKRLGMDTKVSYNHLKEEINFSFQDEVCVELAIGNMVRRGELQEIQNGRMIKRKNN